jgi:hypothetical protein
MKNKGISIYCSTREKPYLKSANFWHSLQDLIDANNLNRIGFSVITPYSVTYKSKCFPRYVTDDLTEYFCDELLKLSDNVVPRRRPMMVVWISTLYNTFLKTDCRQVNDMGESSNYVCPNDPTVMDFFGKAIREISSSNWFSRLSERFRTAFLLDMVQFEGATSCFCKSCRTEFADFLKLADVAEAKKIARELYVKSERNPYYYYLWTLFRENSIANFLKKLMQSSTDEIAEPWTKYVLTRYKEFMGEEGVVETTASITGQSFERMTALDGLKAVDVQLFPVSGNASRFLNENIDSPGLRRSISKFIGMGKSKGKDVSLLLEGWFAGKDHVEKTVRGLQKIDFKNIVFMPFDSDTLCYIMSWGSQK